MKQLERRFFLFLPMMLQRCSLPTAIIRRRRFTSPQPYTLPSYRRAFSIHPILLPPVVFTGLLVSLWTLKSLSLVIFQDRIIYTPYLPPYTRKLPLPSSKETSGIEWERLEDVRGANRAKLAVCQAAVGGKSSGENVNEKRKEKVMIVYFQGNSGNAVLRVPLFSRYVLRGMENSKSTVTFVYPSYRGYWLSTKKANPRGMRRDLPFLLDYLRERIAKENYTRVIFWGQSIGTGIAVTAAGMAQEHSVKVDALILETPFTDIAGLVREVYPQRWLPYYYLTPFLKENWAMKGPLENWWKNVDKLGKVLVLRAEKDELVGEKLQREAEDLLHKICGDRCRVHIVRGAGHQDCLQEKGGKEIQGFVRELCGIGL